ncbi:MAG: FHA domain-containing protein [Gammaproteobacteria bacterium]|nr:FHA domain-containing protein [Gammaproteobacteria bacterium]
MSLADVLARLGLTRLPFGGVPPAAALTGAYATRVSECLRELRAGQVSTVLVSGPRDAGHRAILVALLERLARDGDLSVWFDDYPADGPAFLQALLNGWGLEIEEGMRDDLKALLELFIGHQSGKGHTAYVALPADREPGRAIGELITWLAGLRFDGRHTVRFLLHGEPAGHLPDCLRGGTPELAEGRGLVHHRAPGLLPSESEYYIHTRLKMAGARHPAELIGMELCRLVGAYAEGEVPLIDRLVLTALDMAAADDQAGSLVVRQRHVEAAAARLGLELRSEAVTAESVPSDASAEPERASLVFSAGAEVTHEVELVQPRMVMGRDGDCDISLDSRFISRFQCLFMQTRRGWYVLDLGSTNGTFVNGRRIREHLLRQGDVISIGRHRIRFVADIAAAGESPAATSDDYLSTEFLVSRGRDIDAGDDATAIRRPDAPHG